MLNFLKSRLFFLLVVLVLSGYMAWEGCYRWYGPFELPLWSIGAAALLAGSCCGMQLMRRLKKQVLPTPASLWLLLLLSIVVDGSCNLYAFQTPWQLHLSVLMTMACFCLVWALLRVWSLLFWLTFLLLELIQYGAFLQYGSRINSLVVAETLEASMEEILIYLTPMNGCLLVGGILASLACCWVLYRILRKQKSPALLNAACLFGGLSLLFALLVPPNRQVQDFYWPAAEMPVLWESVSEALTINQATINQVENLPSPTEQPSELLSLKGGEGVVLIVHVGESIRADRMSINGYVRNTTPWLKEQKNLINFPVCISSACDTCQAQIAILTDGRRDIYEKNPELMPKTGSVLDLFEANGFDIYSFFGRRCAQKLKYDRVVRILTRRSVKRYNAPGSPWTSVPQMKEVLEAQEQGQNLVFFINNEGSHTPFYHYNRENPPFAPASSDFHNPAAQAKEVNNAYDSTIHYTDEFVRRVAELLKGRPFVYVYVSDHGEYLGHDGIWGRAGLGESHLSYHATDGCKVGMFVLASPEFYELHPHFDAALQQMRANSTKTVAHEHIFHTLLGLFKLKTPHYNAELDLTQPQVQPYTGSMP